MNLPIVLFLEKNVLILRSPEVSIGVELKKARPE
jgi:hypothetical protein